VAGLPQTLSTAVAGDLLTAPDGAVVAEFARLGSPAFRAGIRPLESSCLPAPLSGGSAVPSLASSRWRRVAGAAPCAPGNQSHCGKAPQFRPARNTASARPVEKARNRDENHPELRAMQQMFSAMTEELRAHMLKDEQILFPPYHTVHASREEPQYLIRAIRLITWRCIKVPLSRRLQEIRADQFAIPIGPSRQMFGSRSKYSSSSFLPPSPLPSIFSDSMNSIRSIHLTIL
jgi:hypothetical protein